MVSKAKEFGQRQRLTVQLKGLVRKYPRGVGIFKEFLQNADVAGADSMSLILDLRHFRGDRLPNAAYSDLLGPALVVVNNRPFTDEDWDRIQEVNDSGKVNDVSKTGRFGLGFNSVYNVTDYPMLLTAGKIAIFDPHERIATSASRTTGIAWDVSDLVDEAPDLLAAFQDYGINLADPNFGSTIFRLPLRTASLASRSEICQEQFTEDDFQAILNGIREHNCGLLLFLNNVLKFDICMISSEGAKTDLLSVDTLNPTDIDVERAKIRSQVSGSNEKVLTDLSLFGGCETTYEHRFRMRSVNNVEVMEWLVSRGVYDSDDLIASAQAMVEIGEKAVPIAGAAMRWNNPVEAGLLSCALPLPMGSGIPLHVDGFFDLEDGRQDLHQDETATSHSNRVRIRWNKTLLHDGCAKAAANLIQRAGQQNGNPGYVHWPTVVPQPHRMVDHLATWIYKELVDRSCISAGPDQEFSVPGAVFQCPIRLRGPLLSDGLLVPNPVIPQHVLDGFCGVERPIPTLESSELRQILRNACETPCKQCECSRRSLRGKDDLIELLKYCLRDKKHQDFDGVPLALMSDGMLRAFDSLASTQIYIGDETVRTLLQPIEGVFIDRDIQMLSVEGLPNVVPMQLDGLVLHLPRVIRSLTTAEDETLAIQLPLPSDEWLADFYGYCVSEGVRLQTTRLPHPEILRTLPLVLDDKRFLWAMGRSNTPVFEAPQERQSWKVELLSTSDIQFVSGIGKVGDAVARFKKHFSCHEIPSFTSEYLANFLIDNFEKVSEVLTSEPLLTERVIEYLASDFAAVASDHISTQLASLPIFPKVGGGLTAIRGQDVYLSSNFNPPNVSFDVTVLSAKDEQQASMLRSLGAKTLTEAQYVHDFVLPKFSQLSMPEQIETLNWLRCEYYSILSSLQDHESNDLRKQIATSRIVQCSDGILRSPSEIYHPECAAAATLLGTSAHSPDSERFSDTGWLETLVTWGMSRTVRASDVIRVIDELISVTHTNVNSDKLLKIVVAIEQNWASLNDQMCGTDTFIISLTKRAWLPAITDCPDDVPKALFNPPTKVLHFPSELLAHQYAVLASSVAPVCRFPLGKQLQHSLGMKALLIADVLKQFEAAIVDAGSSGLSKDHARVIRAVYNCLGATILNPNNAFDGRELLAKYAGRPCVLDGNDQLWPPNHCFKANIHFFLGTRKRINSQNANEEAFLTAIGRKSTPDANDFRCFFRELPNQFTDLALDEDQLAKLREAYRLAASPGAPNEFSDCPVLTSSGSFCGAAELLIDDAPWLSRRARASGVEFLDNELGATVATVFGVGQLSVVVEEHIESWSPSELTEHQRTCRQINAVLHSPEFIKGLYRLSPLQTRDGQIAETLRPFQLVAASNIQTSLYWDGNPLEGSIGQTDMVLEGDTLYLDAMRQSVLCKHVSTAIARRLLGKYHFEDDSTIQLMLAEPPEQIESLLDELRVPNLPEDVTLEIDEKLETVENEDQAPPDSFHTLPNAEVIPPPSSNNGHPAEKPALDAGQPKDIDESTIPSSFASGVPKPRPQTTASRPLSDPQSRNRRAVTYVGGNDSKLASSESSSTPSHRSNVDASAINCVQKHEQRCGRLPTVMEHFNEGYDIESREAEGGDVVRYIEVKGLSGAWNEFGVKLSSAQIRFAIGRQLTHWVYVVEFALDPTRTVIYAIRNPLAKVTDFRLDGGWKELCDETWNATQNPIRVGSRISYDGIGEGEVLSIDEFGAFKKLQIRFDSGQTQRIRFPDPKIIAIHS